MKITIFQIVALSVVANVAAQNAKERLKIQSVQDKAAIEVLKNELRAQENERRARVAKYLSENNTAKPQYTFNGSERRLYDVVNGKPIYIGADNASEARAIRTNRLYPNGTLGLSLEGEGMTAGIWDVGLPLATHQEFQNGTVSRVSVLDTDADLKFHPTHVAGTVAAKGIVSNAKGMAPKVNVKQYDLGDDNSEMMFEAGQGLLVSNHSYGVYVVNEGVAIPSWIMGCYNSSARGWDMIAVNFPYYLPVKAAGNDGVSSYEGGFQPGLDKLTYTATSKNVLVVANADTSTHPITGAFTNLSINLSSSQGPTDDGRIKPDITADGTDVTSTAEVNNTAYDEATGTSMASPGITGSIVLLQEHYRNLHSGNFMRSATVKGLICHTALDDNDYPGPDPRFGWGVMDSAASATIISNDANGNQAVIRQTDDTNALTNTGANSTYVFNFTVGAAGPLKATLCWTDPAGNAQDDQLNSTVPALVNDLDLRITNGTTTYYPWKLNMADLNSGAIKGDNLVDNVERVDIDVAEPGQYTLTVSHKGTLVSGPQQYSLILSGANVILGEDEHQFRDVIVWPNPAKEVLHVNFAQPLENANIALVDIAGRVVYQAKAGNDANITIDTAGFSKGVYMLNVNSDNKSLSKKVVIE
ncbi:S8 family serine peptidase [Flavobacterium sp. RHBU_24]|uniref:S8 family serine peptidase n=1 Tax=Flavobacterium sp. RHBU_24 TaxID=3391185 RepID=UPI0039852430